MLKQPLTYKDFNGDTVTNDFYFNLTKTEVIELQVYYKDGPDVWLANVTKSNDNQAILAEFKRLILLAYGEKSADGERFVKSDELREAFKYTAAFDHLFMKMFLEPKFAAEFITALMPDDLDEVGEKLAAMDAAEMAKEVEKAQKKAEKKAEKQAVIDAIAKDEETTDA